MLPAVKYTGTQAQIRQQLTDQVLHVIPPCPWLSKASIGKYQFPDVLSAKPRRSLLPWTPPQHAAAATNACSLLPMPNLTRRLSLDYNYMNLLDLYQMTPIGTGFD
jgi:hypothetical protein